MASANWLGTIPLGTIYEWKLPKDAQLDYFSFPGKDSGAAEVYDTLGVLSSITIKGYLMGTFKYIQGLIYDVRNIQDGNQSSYVLLKSPFVNSNFYTSSGGTKTRRIGTIGTITSTTSNKLIDSTSTFITNGVQIGDVVKNLIANTTAIVVAIDSETQLSIDTDIFTNSNVPYSCTGTIRVKVNRFEPTWTLPGLGICGYELEVIQVIG